MKTIRTHTLRIMTTFMLAVAACPLYGEQENGRLKVVSVNDGLPQQAITSITQDRYGFVWLGTYDGLCRYDGTSFATYHNVPGESGTLTGNRILSTFEDVSGNIWVGTEGTPSLNLYDPAHDRFIVPRDQPWQQTTTIEQDPEGRIWIGTDSGIFTFSPATAPVFEKMNIPEGELKSVQKIVRDADGKMWILASGKIFCMESRSKPIRIYDEGFIRYATTIYCTPSCDLLVPAASAIHIKHSGNDTFENISLPITPSAVTQIGQGSWMVGTEGQGVLILSEKRGGGYKISKPDFADDRFFNFNLIRLFFHDNTGCLWIGSGHNGVAILDMNAKPFKTARMPVREGHHFIRSVMRDSKGRLWYGIKLGGLYMLEDDNLHNFGIEPRQNFNAIFEDSKGNIWICTSRNVYIWRGGRIIELRELPGIPQEVFSDFFAANAIVEDRLGAIWIGGTGGMLRLSNPFTRDFVCEYTEDTYTRDIYCMEYDPAEDRLWIGSRSYGVYRVDLDRNQRVKTYEEFSFTNSMLKSDKIWSLHIGESDGTLWVGTDNGLSSMVSGPQGTVIADVAYSPKLANGKIMCVLEDRDGCLWLNSSQGLLRYNPAEGFYREYYYSDGLCSNTTTEAGFVDSYGNIYVGTVDGLNYFDPGQIRDDEYIAAPVLVSLRINNKPVEYRGEDRRSPLSRNIMVADTILISHRNNNFTLEFLSPDFRNPHRLSYSYMLEGADKQWNLTSSENRTASYNRLRAGEYRFKVKAANSDGIWGPPSREVIIKVSPAPWNTWWAWLGYVGIVLSVIFTILRYYYAQYKLKKDFQIEQIQREHERVLNDTKMKFHTNISHEIRTSLALISAPLDDVMSDEAILPGTAVGERLSIVQRNVSHLNDLVSQLLDLNRIDNDNLPFQTAPCDLVKLVSNVCSCFGDIAARKGVGLEMIAENDSLPGLFDADKIIKITSNLVSNALKFTESNGQVTVFTGMVGEFAEIAVEDTGCGIAQQDLDKIFDRYYQADSSSRTGMGIGLSLVKRLVELHNGTIRVSSSEGEGSLFIVSIPIAEEDLSRSMPEAEAGKPEEPHQVSNPQRPIVMIVEDNPDMARYLNIAMRDHYNIITENNAEAALIRVNRHIPDLVLLDVMLPDRSGLWLCRAIKNDMLTNHIPVLIISAKDTQHDITVGYQAGAEDYILKPFSIKLLLMKVGNIINSRHRMISRHEGADAVISPNGNPFMDKLLGIIRENLHETGVDMQMICRRMATSRTQLYRKLKATTDKTISDLIRDERMDKAYKLIASRQYNVSEVMCQVGIGSNSYFTKTFKEYFGVLPSEMLKKN